MPNPPATMNYNRYQTAYRQHRENYKTKYDDLTKRSNDESS